MSTIEITTEQYRTLIALARQTLHTAYVWNDHNFDHPMDTARKTATEKGIPNFDAANGFLASLPPSQGTITQICSSGDCRR